jgi:uncharacterized protein (TIGR00369 family)
MTIQDRIQRLLDGDDLSSSAAWQSAGLKLIEAEPGRSLVEMVATAAMTNFQGICHGGYIALLADSAMGSALATMLPDGERHMSFDLKLSFMRPVQIGQSVRATGTVVHHGRRTAVGECRLQVGGDLVGTASASFIVYLPEKDS